MTPKFYAGQKIIMLKNIIIITVIVLLLATISNISPINAQSLGSKSAKSLENQKSKVSQDNGEDYHRSVNERFVINTLKDLYQVEARYKKTFGVGYFGTLADLAANNLIDEALASGEKYGYIFSVSVQFPDAVTPARFFVTARPRVYGRTGTRSFYMDSSCVVRGGDKNGMDADETDPAIETCAPTLAYEYENQMMLAMRKLHGAEATYISTYGLGTYGTFEQLYFGGLIDYVNPIHWDYSFTITTTIPTVDTPAGFRIVAIPQIYPDTGLRSLFVDENGVQRGAVLGGEPADENSPPLIFEDEDLTKFVMRTLVSGQTLYRSNPALGAGNFAASFAQLYKTRVIDLDLSNGTYGGYKFEMIVNNTAEPFFSTFEIRATPIIYGKGSIRSFYVNEISPLRGADRGGQNADEFDPVVEH